MICIAIVERQLLKLNLPVFHLTGRQPANLEGLLLTLQGFLVAYKDSW